MRTSLSILRLRRIVAVFALCILPMAARAQAPATAAPTSPAQSAATGDYMLRPADILQIKVFQEEDLTREVSVSREYAISLPLIGTVDLKNRSVRQAEELIRQLYDRDFLKNPQVTVIVLKYAERAVNVIGQVNSPQAVPFPAERGLTLLEAIARAGGFNRYADKKRVTITRTDEKGATTTFTINVEKLIESQSQNQWPLQVDDVVDVKERTF